MSQAGAKAQRKTQVARVFSQHAKEIARQVADQFQPVYENVCRERDRALERAAILQTAVEMIAAGQLDAAQMLLEAQRVLDQLGIVPDIQTVGDGG